MELIMKSGSCTSSKFQRIVCEAGWTNVLMSMIALRRSSCQSLQARSSVGERFLDTEEVGSSILPVPTILT
jgi:hypothetical protein